MATCRPDDRGAGKRLKSPLELCYGVLMYCRFVRSSVRAGNNKQATCYLL